MTTENLIWLTIAAVVVFVIGFRHGFETPDDEEKK